MLKKISVSLASLLAVSFLSYQLIPTAQLYRLIQGAERNMAGLEVHRVQISDSDIEYLRGGEGPTLLLLHGFGADKDNWTRLAKYLTPQFDVIALDLPGFGNSSQDADLDYDVLPQVERVKQFADRLQLDDFHLAGSSMGGYIAGNFAKQYTERVASLTLVSPFGVTTSQPSDMFLAISQGEPPIIVPRSQDEFAALINFIFVDPPYFPDSMIEYLGTRAAQSAPFTAQLFEQIHHMKNGQPHPRAPLDQTLKGLALPTLVLWGDTDRVLHVSGAHVLQTIIPGAQVVVMEHVGHLPMLEKPGETADILLAFLRAQD